MKINFFELYGKFSKVLMVRLQLFIFDFHFPWTILIIKAESSFINFYVIYYAIYCSFQARDTSLVLSYIIRGKKVEFDCNSYVYFLKGYQQDSYLTSSSVYCSIKVKISFRLLNSQYEIVCKFFFNSYYFDGRTLGQMFYCCWTVDFR